MDTGFGKGGCLHWRGGEAAEARVPLGGGCGREVSTPPHKAQKPREKAIFERLGKAQDARTVGALAANWLTRQNLLVSCTQTLATLSLLLSVLNGIPVILNPGLGTRLSKWRIPLNSKGGGGGYSTLSTLPNLPLMGAFHRVHAHPLV